LKKLNRSEFLSMTRGAASLTVLRPRDTSAAGAEKECTLGTSNHPHYIIVTAADFTKLQAGTAVTSTPFDKPTSTGHGHDVTVNC